MLSLQSLVPHRLRLRVAAAMTDPDRSPPRIAGAILGGAAVMTLPVVLTGALAWAIWQAQQTQDLLGALGAGYLWWLGAIARVFGG